MATLGSQPGIVTRVTSTDVAIYFEVPDAPLIVGVTVKTSTGTYAIGTLLGQYAADQKFGKYTDSGTVGMETAVGIILTEIDTADGDQQANMLVGSALVLVSELTGADASDNYVTDLNGRLILNDSVLVI